MSSSHIHATSFIVTGVPLSFVRDFSQHAPRVLAVKLNNEGPSFEKESCLPLFSLCLANPSQVFKPLAGVGPAEGCQPSPLCQPLGV